MVHITSGVSALVCALYLGKRTGYPSNAMKPHNLVLSFIGACLLWVGWFGFNAGSALAASGLATSAFVATHFGAAAAALGWMVAEWMHNGKPSVLGGISGAWRGWWPSPPLPASSSRFPALLIGLCAGVVCYFMVVKRESQVRLRRFAGCFRRARLRAARWARCSPACSPPTPSTTD